MKRCSSEKDVPIKFKKEKYDKDKAWSKGKGRAVREAKNNGEADSSEVEMTKAIK